MQVGPLILYSALVGALSGAAVAGFSWLLRTLQGFFMGNVLGYLPPGLVSEGGLNQVFAGPRHWLVVLLLPACSCWLATWVLAGGWPGFYRLTAKAEPSGL